MQAFKQAKIQKEIEYLLYSFSALTNTFVNHSNNFVNFLFLSCFIIFYSSRVLELTITKRSLSDTSSFMYRSIVIDKEYRLFNVYPTIDYVQFFH